MDTGQQEKWGELRCQNNLYSAHRSQKNPKHQWINNALKKKAKFPESDAARQIQEILLSWAQTGDFWE